MDRRTAPIAAPAIPALASAEPATVTKGAAPSAPLSAIAPAKASALRDEQVGARTRDQQQDGDDDHHDHHDGVG